MSRSQLSLSDVIEAALQSFRGSLYHSMPASVTAFHPGGSGNAPTVDVQPAVNDVRFDLDTNERVSEPWPVIPNVPIAFPRFGGFTISGPMQAGDRVLLVAFDLDPSAHRSSGKRSDPPDVRRHGGNYWWAVPADITDPNAMADNADAGTELVIGREGAQPQIRINGSRIRLGASGGDHVALANKVDQITAALKVFVQLFGSSPIVAVSSGIAIPSLATAATNLASAISSVASMLLEAQ